MAEKSLETLLAEQTELTRQINEKQIAPLETALAILDRTAIKTAVADLEKLLPELEGYQRDILVSFVQTPTNLSSQLRQRLDAVKATSVAIEAGAGNAVAN